MKKSSFTIKLDRLLGDKDFEQLWKDDPDLFKAITDLKEYDDSCNHQNLMRTRLRKINKLKNEINLEK